MKSLYILLLLVFALPTAIAAKPLPQQQVDRFISEMVKKHKLDKTELQQLFSELEERQDILQAISKPAERTLVWHQYRAIFLKEQRIRAGAEFWQQHKQILQRAEQKFGVPAAIIVAIIGVETRFGQYEGKYRVAESLATLAFSYPKRSAFFRGQLEEFLLLVKEEKMDASSLLGSYAGAMGQPQFIPSSYRAYAIDFDGDGVRDLWNSPSDVIGSVANYLAKHNWNSSQPIAEPVTLKSATTAQSWIGKGYTPSVAFENIAKYGVTSAQKIEPKTEVALLELQQEKEKEYWLGFPNFYAITRYNHSTLYAMAVFQLSQAIRDSYLANGG